MPLSPALALCLGGVFCLSLLALHLLRLAALNARPRPAVVSARWDFAATLGGLAGFIGVGSLVAAGAGQAVFSATRQPTWEAIRERPRLVLAAGPWAGVGFGGLLVAAVAVGCWTRRDSLEVYNVGPAAVPAVAADALAAVGLPAGSLALGWTTLPRLAHATVRVRGLDPAGTRELLAHLRAGLRAAPTGGSPAVLWLTAAAGGLIAATFVLIGVFAVATRTV
jgi:hypothetical protein